MHKTIDTFFDFLYLILMKPVSFGFRLIRWGLSILVTISALSIKLKSENLEINITDESSIFPVLENCLFALAMFMIAIGLFMSLFDWFKNHKGDTKRAKSIDLRSLTHATAPCLHREFNQKIESSFIHNDLFLQKKDSELYEDWLNRSAEKITNFGQLQLTKIYEQDSNTTLALGALAHVPHCFALGFSVTNRRLAHYYCWDRDRNNQKKSKWVDCRNKRPRNNKIETEMFRNLPYEKITNDEVTKVALSIELSISSNIKKFMEESESHIGFRVKFKHQEVGALFSEKDQVKIVKNIRDFLNNNVFNNYENIKELHITITAQASFIMRLGAEMNQNHFPALIKIYHFERPNYPWSFSLTPNSAIIDYTLYT